MITKQEMLDTVKKQLAVDYNCNTDDFNRDGIAFTKAVKLEGRRKVPFLTPRCEVITMGSGIIVNASADVLNFAKKKIEWQNTQRGAECTVFIGFLSLFSSRFG